MMDINTLLTLDLAEYTTALEALADQMMLEEPRDIDYMRRRKLDTGREFAVWNFTVGYCMNAADALSLLRAQANENANDGTADLATINNSAARLCDWFSGAFDVTGKMDDTTAILAHSRDLYAQVETHEQFAALTRATERYLVQLQFWVDRQIPWPAISDLVCSTGLLPRALPPRATTIRSGLPRGLDIAGILSVKGLHPINNPRPCNTRVY